MTSTSVRLTLSWSLVCLAIAHATAIVGGWYLTQDSKHTSTPIVIPVVKAMPGPPNLVDTLPVNSEADVPLKQPDVTSPPVNRSALDEVKKQGPVTYRPIDGYGSGQPAPPPKAYELALFVSTDARSRTLLEWFNTDPKLQRVKALSNYQVYTKDNALYKTRFANIVPPEQFPAVVFQHVDGGHIHAAGGNFIPRTPELLFADFCKGVENAKQVREHGQRINGLIRTAGYSWDNTIAPNMHLPNWDGSSLGQCPDCPNQPNRPSEPIPLRPNDGGTGGGSLDDLFDTVNETTANLDPKTIGMGALVLVGVGLLLAIIRKHS